MTPTNSIQATVIDGRLVIDQRLDLPDGTKLVIPLPSSPADETPACEAGWSDTPEAIEAWLEWYDTLEPLIFTPEEEAALAQARAEQKQLEKARFIQEGDRLREIFE
jgi:hypothetical protein